MKILRSTFVSHSLVNCLNRHYTPLQPSNYGWEKDSSVWMPVWYEGEVLPALNDLEVISDNDIVFDTHEVANVEENSDIAQDVRMISAATN